MNNALTQATISMKQEDISKSPDAIINVAVPVASTRISARVIIYGMNYAPEPTGVGRYTGEIGEYLATQGLNIEVITAPPHYPGWKIRNGYRNRYSLDVTAHGRVTRCPLVLKADMRGMWRFIAPLTFALTSAPIVMWRIFSFRPDIVLCVEPTLLAAPVALLSAKLTGTRTALHVQDLEVDAAFAVGHVRGSWLFRLAHFFERIVLRSFDSIITISNRMREQIVAKGVVADRVGLVRNWVDLEKIRPMSGPSPYRSELGFSDTDYVALYAGNVGPKQALSIVLEAAEAIAGRAAIKFVIVGDGPEKKRIVSRFGHLPNVKFLSVQPEERLSDLLNLADVHLLPQNRGAADLVLPSKLGGMLASGKPSIVMADPGTELFEFLGDGAIIIPPGDSDALARAIIRFSSGESRVSADNMTRILALNAAENLRQFKAHILNQPAFQKRSLRQRI
jgi:colanic acid biosynthesis glycosyl transferase WcaI